MFARHGLPPRPIFLRDPGRSRAQFITGTHGDHRTDAIQTILDANPDLPFTLPGDTGQHAPMICATIIRDNPGRITRVILRQTPPQPDPQARGAIAEIKAAGIALHPGNDYRVLPE